MLLFILSLASIDDLLMKNNNLNAKKSINKSDFLPGWYFFNIKHKSFLRQLNITIKTSNLITNRWACVFLDSSRISRILSNSSYEIIPERKISLAQTLSTSEDNIYLIEAHDNYIPTESEKFYKNFYISTVFPKDNEFIRSITQLPRAELLNRWTKGVVQSENFNLHFEDQIRLVPYQPFFKHNINGKNEIVTIIDSGIDHRHCFYHDPKQLVPFDQTNFNHRKIVRYQVISDRFDGENGHGTHVSGIIAGKSICANCSSSMYNGIAPEAKIFFVDTGDEKDPVSLTQYFSFASIISISQSLNSHVFSNSWGFPPSTKKVRQMFDRIAFDNPYISFLFGTGNSRHFFDIFTPANSKNVISVGNIEISQVRIYKDGFHDIFYLLSKTRNKSFKIKNLNFSKSILNEITFSDKLKSYQQKKIVKFNETIDNYGNSFVYLENCKEMPNLENKSISILFINSRNNSIFERYHKKIKFPIFSISNSLNQNEIVSIRPSINYSGLNDSLSIVNSYGPTKSGLLKPEIFAPGNETMSARGAFSHKPPHSCNNKDGLIKKSGTSMSTPAVAGAVLLLIQYFRDGFYPTCKKNFSNSILISSMLVRSILVNSASGIKNIELDNKPSLNGGFGSIHLSNSLLLDQNLTENGFRVCDRIKILSKQDIFTTIIVEDCKNMSPLRITLTWLDPPLDTKSKMPLFADLDLYVVTPSQKVVYGNNYDFEDSHSSTEKIIINNPQKGEYQVHVHCPKLHISDTVIYFSMSINGPFDQLNFEKNPKYLVFTKSKDCIACKGIKCQDDSSKCICYENQTGIHCNNQVFLINFGFNRFILSSRKPIYLYCQIPNNLTDTQFLRVEFTLVESLLVHMNIGINQVPKFGGKFLNFVVMKSNQNFEINPHENDKFKKGSLIYFDLYEATIKNPTLFVNLSIQSSLISNTSEPSKQTHPFSPLITIEMTKIIQKSFMNYIFIILIIVSILISFFWIFKKRRCSLKKIKSKMFDYERLP